MEKRTVDPYKLISYLSSFNSKERYYLLKQVIGKPFFKPSSIFLSAIEKNIQETENINKQGSDYSIPELDFSTNSFFAMDYHLDWLYASLYLSTESRLIFSTDNPFKYLHKNVNKALIQGNQEDIDFIIAYHKNKECHIILIEAKGVTEHSNEQMGSKAARLKAIFGDSENDRIWDRVVPHFILLSPKKPSKLNTEGFPTWMTTVEKEVPYMCLDIDPDLQYVSRCDKEGEPNKKGSHWICRPR